MQRKYGGSIVEFGEIVWARIPNREEARKAGLALGSRSFGLERQKAATNTSDLTIEERRDSLPCVASPKAADGGAK